MHVVITGSSGSQEGTRRNRRSRPGEVQSPVGHVRGRGVLVGERGSEGGVSQLRRNRYLTVEDRRGKLEDIGDRDVGNGAGLAQRGAVERTSGGKPVAGKDPVPELGDRDPLGGVDLEHAAEDGVQFGREGEDRPEEVGVLEEGPEGAVRLGRPLPRVPAAGEVDEDNTERPNIVGGRSVARGSAGGRLLAFRGHVEGGTAAKVGSDGLGRGEAEVGEFDLGAVLGDEDVLGFQVAVVDSEGVAVFDGVEQLEEDPLGEDVVTDIVSPLGDVGEQVTLGAVLHDHVGAVGGVEDLDEVDDVGVSTRAVVQRDLTLLELSLASIQADLRERLYRVRGAGEDIDSSVNDTVRTDTKDTGQFYPTSQKLTNPILWPRDEGGV